MTLFDLAFSTAREALGLMHYHVTIREGDLAGLYAEISPDPENGVATVRWDRARCEADDVVQATAVHEALHLLLADLVHAAERSPATLAIEEERAVRRLEVWVDRGLFSKPEQISACDDPTKGDIVGQ